MLTVNDLMTAVPDTVTPQTPLRIVIGIMKTGGYRQIPVLNKGQIVVIITVSPEMPAYRAAEMLSMYKFGALPVIEGTTLVGIISTTDFLNYFSANIEGEEVGT